MLSNAGFVDVAITERGNDIAAIANKLIVLSLRLASPRPLRRAVWTWLLLLLVAPVASAFLAAAHLSMALGLGSTDDPLGYFVQTRRADALGSTDDQLHDR